MAQSSGLKVVVAAIGGNGFITVIKFVGWFFTASPSLMAEAVHSLADTLNQILLLIGLKQSEKEAKGNYPTGLGKSRYVWNLISAVGIFFLGFGVTAYHGMHALFSKGDYSPKVNWIGITVLVISFIIEFWVLVQAYKEVKRAKGEQGFIDYFLTSDDPTSVAILLEDGVAVLGVVLALTGVILGNIFKTPMFDIVASLLIALLLGFMAILLGVVNGKLLLGRRAPVHKESEFKKYIEDLPEVLELRSFSSKILGAGELRVSVEVELYSELLIDKEMLSKESQRLKDGMEPTRVLFETSERVARNVGRVINKLEIQIVEQFPEIKVLDFEVS